MEIGEARLKSARGRLVPYLLGVLSFLAVLFTIDGPGITVDEPLDVRPGREYLRIAASTGLRFFSREVVERTYFDNKEHPPLGRWLLGVASRVFEPVEVMLRQGDPVGLYVRAGRVAPAVCFGILVFLVSRAGGRLGGVTGSTGAGLGLLMMPRVFGHAHLAALDTFVALLWTASVLALDWAMRRARPIAALPWAGLVWGLALLVKIHAWLLPPLVLVACLYRLGFRRGVLGFSVWFGVGFALFFVGWPWLWYDPIARLQAYMGTVARSPTLVEYFGSIYKDTNVPWHYPWVYFLTTVPLGLQLLGVWGVYQMLRERGAGGNGLVLASILAWLMLFSTRVPVYDGERLFLPAFSLWAVAIGRGFSCAWGLCEKRRVLRVLLGCTLVLQSVGVWQMSPFWLSYYNSAVGGLWGAERLGLEITYWGDAVDNGLLDRLVEVGGRDDRCALAPTLAPSQGRVMTNFAMARRGLILEDQEDFEQSRWVVIYRRSSYWRPDVAELAAQTPVLLRTRQGVWISGLWERTPTEVGGTEKKRR
jgi:hypothetical protein